MDTKKLRQKILDLAIRGKLVPQDPNDEPASVLLERIRAEKERLVKEGKIKKSKASKTSDTPHYENRQIGEANVPKGWCITNIGELLINRDGERIPISSAIRNKQENKIYDYYGAAGVIDKVNDYIFNERLLLIGEDGANLLSRSKDNAFFAEGKYWVNNHAHVLDATDKSLLDYVAIVINAIKLDDYVTGSAQPKLSQDNLNKILIFLPPLKEQKRILVEIKHWYALIDAIETGKTDLRISVKQAKCKILDLAIHGKLVPQNPNDEPASELLKRINPKAEITCDNGQYEKLPDGWGLIMISQVVELLSGRDLTSNDCNEDEEGVPYLIGASNIVNNHLNITRWTKNPQVISSIGDILISCKGTIGEIVLNDIGNIHVARQFMVIRPNKNSIVTEYLQYYLLAMVHNIKENARGVIPGISREDILTKYFPLPPLAEQQRIVDAIDNTFAKLDAIMESL